MASGRPAIFVGPARCESAEAISAADCGAVIDPISGRAAARLVEMLRSWSRDPARMSELGARGRAAFESLYERERNCDEFTGVLKRAWSPDVSEESALVPELAR